jgi:hypothetical protein
MGFCCSLSSAVPGGFRALKALVVEQHLKALPSKTQQVDQQMRCWIDGGCFEALVEDPRKLLREFTGRNSSQDLTAEWILVNADSGVHPNLLNSRFGDVSVFRASHEATVFTHDMNKLSLQLSAVSLKTSARTKDVASAVCRPRNRQKKQKALILCHGIYPKGQRSMFFAAFLPNRLL